MVSPEEKAATDSESSCDDIVFLDKLIKSNDIKKKKKRRRGKKKNKKINLDGSGSGAVNSEFIVLDSTGFSSQCSDKEDGELDPTDDVDNDVKASLENTGNDEITPVHRKNSLLALFEKPRNISCDDLFQIDTTPSTKDSVAVPKYQSNYDEAITGLEKKADENKPRRRGGAMCWNCGTEGHQIRECKQKRNPMMINKFRMEAQAKRTFRMLQSRYHEDEATQYGTPIPGMPSEKLREALGLGDNQLPAYVYRMRVLGYPPGWLEEAKVHHSGINMFDSKGNPVQDPNDEEGEIISQGERDQFDLNKLVEFPGFNVPPPKNTEDETEFFEVPPISSEQSLESLIASLKPKAVQAYRKRKLAMMQSGMNSDDDEYDCDYMETEEIQDGEELPPDSCKFTPCPPSEEPPIPPPPPGDSGGEKEEGEEEDEELIEADKANHKSASSSRSQSPSLTQLEKYKTELLSQLNTTSTSGVHRTPVASLGKIKSVEQGTPVLQLSPYQQLPKFENFQKNVSDIINFENLPDSTGKYDKLIPLIHKVKKVMSKINESS